MQDFQQKYLEEKRKYDNLLRMQNTILADTEEYIAAFLQLKIALAERQRVLPPEPNDEVTPQEAHQLVAQAVSALFQPVVACQCDRWRTLYQQEARESARISLEKEELLSTLIDKEQTEQLDRVEINKLLQEYLELYRKDTRGEHQTQKKEKKEKRSRSKGHSQTDRREVSKNAEEVEGAGKQISSVTRRLQTELGKMQKQLQEARRSLIEKEQLIRLYRSKERKHLLAGGQLLD